MPRSRLALSLLAALALVVGGASARAEGGVAASPGLSIGIDDFAYLDTSGEVIDQTAVHQKRLDAFMRNLREDIAAERGVRLVAPAEVDKMSTGIRIVGGVQKTSTLVQWAKVAVIDVGANRVLFEKLYTFRGDTDEAWDHARQFLSREVRKVLAAATPGAAPIGLAVFTFELEDTTAAAQGSGIAPADAASLAEVTDGVRQLLAQSGRYRVIDAGGANGEAAQPRALRDCDGCDAALAAKLGADQSLIGVVRRVSRTEYTIGFQVRDARSGAVITRGDSGLRMGADYSWTRGAVRLIGDRLLEAAQH